MSKVQKGVNESENEEEECLGIDRQVTVQIPKRFQTLFRNFLERKDQLTIEQYLKDKNPINEENYFEWKRFQEENFVALKVPADIQKKKKKGVHFHWLFEDC